MDIYAYANLIKNIILNFPTLDRIYLKIEAIIFNIFKKKNFKKEAANIIKRNLKIYKIITSRLQRHTRNFTITNKTILEIGPGSSLILAILFILNGAKKVILIDRYKQIYNNEFNRKLNKLFIKFYIRKSHKGSIRDYQEIMERIEYFGYSGIENLMSIKKNSVDLVFSLSVLEHVDNLKKAISVVSFILKPKGYFYNSIDLRDHFHIRDKCYLDFLKYPNTFWNLIGHTNRERYYTYIKLFQKYNFNIIKIILRKFRSLEKINEIKKNFNKKYSKLSADELSISSFKILAQRL